GDDRADLHWRGVRRQLHLDLRVEALAVDSELFTGSHGLRRERERRLERRLTAVTVGELSERHDLRLLRTELQVDLVIAPPPGVATPVLRRFFGDDPSIELEV